MFLVLMEKKQNSQEADVYCSPKCKMVEIDTLGVLCQSQTERMTELTMEEELF